MLELTIAGTIERGKHAAILREQRVAARTLLCTSNVRLGCQKRKSARLSDMSGLPEADLKLADRHVR
jgi:hypothetical protein